MTDKTEITKMIDDLVAEQTFSLDAVERIKQIRDANLQLAGQLEVAEASRKRLAADAAKAQEQRDEADQRAAELGEKLAAAQDLIAKAQQYKAEAEKQQAVAYAYKDAMQIVFKPHTTRESVCRSVPVAANGYVSNHLENTTTTVEQD